VENFKHVRDAENRDVPVVKINTSFEQTATRTLEIEDICEKWTGIALRSALSPNVSSLPLRLGDYFQWYPSVVSYCASEASYEVGLFPMTPTKSFAYGLFPKLHD